MSKITDKIARIERDFMIIDKAGNLVPMKLAKVQRHYIENRTNRNICLKGRQMKFSTGVLADEADDLFYLPYQRQTLITHDSETSEFLFQTIQRFYRNLPHNRGLNSKDMKPKHDWRSGTRMRFPVIDNYIYVDSAKSDSVGAGHTLNRCHLSEISKFPDRKARQLWADITQTVPFDTGIITAECYDGDTEVLTDEGWVKISELDGQKVLTKDSENNAYYVEPVKYFQGISPEMIHFKAECVDLLVTPNHNVWYVSGQQWGNHRHFEKAENLANRTRVRFDCFFNWQGEDEKVFILPGHKATYVNKKDLPDVEINADDWCEYLGYFISEGWVQDYRVSIGQDVRSPFYLIMRECVARIAKQLGKELKETFHGKCSFMTIYDIRLVNLLRSYTQPKRIPRFIMNLSKRQIKIFMDAYWLGDGEQKRKRCFTKDKELADGLQELGLKLGYNPSMRFRRWKQDLRLRFKGLTHSGYNISLKNQFPCVKKHQIHRIKWEKEIYCITVPGTHLLLVRRNNKVVWSGNSTPQGHGLFKEVYTDAKNGNNGFKPFFYPWWWDGGYVADPALYVTAETAENCAIVVGQALANYLKDEKMLAETYNLSPHQIAFRRMKLAEIKLLFFQEYPENDMDCWLSNDLSVIPGSALRPYYANAREGRTEGDVTIWKDVRGDRSYVIGVDCASGQARDWSVASVLDVRTMEYVARLRAKVNTDIFAQMLWELGRRYNLAYIGVERDGHGRSVLKTLLERNYPALHYHADYDEYKQQNMSDAGWKTSMKTKPLMINGMITAFTSGDLISWSENLLYEASNLIWENGIDTRVRTVSGCNDDEFDAVSIAIQLRESAPILESVIGGAIPVSHYA